MAENPLINTGIDFPRVNSLVRLELLKIGKNIGQDFSLNKLHPLAPIAGKGYTAKGQAELEYNGQPVGNGILHTILFRPGEGTGNDKDFNLPGVPASWTPRKKTDYAEVFFPIGTIYDGNWFPGRTALTAFTTDGKEIRLYTDLMMKPRELFQEVTEGKRLSPVSNFGLTLHKEATGGSKGDPHSIVFDDREIQAVKSLGIPFFQVGGFLSFSDRPEHRGQLEAIFFKDYDTCD